MRPIADAADRDLTGWTGAWLDRAGTDTISLDGTTLLASSPDGGEPRVHALRIGAYPGATRGSSGWATSGSRPPAPRRTCWTCRRPTCTWSTTAT